VIHGDDPRRTGPALARGLSEAEVTARLGREGYNGLPTARRGGFITIAADLLHEPMFVLLVACGVIYVALGDPQEAFMLLCFVFLITGRTLYQEHKRGRALDRLRDLAARARSSSVTVGSGASPAGRIPCMTAGSSIVAMRCIRPEQRGQGPRAGTRRARSVPRGGPERRPGDAASLGHLCPTGAGRGAASRRVNPRKRARLAATPDGNRNALGENRPRRPRAARGGSGSDIAEAILPFLEKGRGFVRY
jgi:hypothetical protein